jgi:UPF0755 protein
MKKTTKYILIIAVIAIAIGIFFTSRVIVATAFFKNESKIFYLENECDVSTLADLLYQDSIISSPSQFLALASLKNFESARPGRFQFMNSESHNSIINKIRARSQKPLLIKVEGVRSIQQLAGVLGAQLQADSSQFISAFTSTAILEKYGVQKEEISSLIFPNTYEFYWTISPEEFLEKMMTITDEYWTEEKIKKAEALKMTKAEVYTLASIVKGETVTKSEAPKIAGLYLNRLRVNQALQADPTLTFENYNGSKARVKLSNADPNSRYNTYKNTGLPPGPVFFTEPIYLDAVLNAESHNYFYMCAQPRGTGLHDFARTFSEHGKYVSAYRKWQREANIN